jgi:hypothetical protein
MACNHIKDNKHERRGITAAKFISHPRRRGSRAQVVYHPALPFGRGA